MYRYQGVPCPDPCLPAGLTQRDIDEAYGYPGRRGRTEEEEFERGDRLMDDDRENEKQADKKTYPCEHHPAYWNGQYCERCSELADQKDMGMI